MAVGGQETGQQTPLTSDKIEWQRHFEKATPMEKTTGSLEDQAEEDPTMIGNRSFSTLHSPRTNKLQRKGEQKNYSQRPITVSQRL